MITHKKKIFTNLIFITVILSLLTLQSSAILIKNTNDEKNQYALLIGYGAGLEIVTKDAIDMKNVLLKYGWNEEDIKTVLGFKATKSNILNSITEWLDNKEQINDDVLIYFSIHGGKIDEDGYSYYESLDEPDNKEEFIIPVEFSLRHPEYPLTPFGCDYSLAIMDEELNQSINHLESENIAIIFESCYSGGMIDGDMDLKTPGRIVLTSSEASTESWIDRTSLRGFFTNNLIKGLKGEADKEENGGNNNGKISIQEIFNYAKPRTTNEVYKKWCFTQEPQIFDGYESEFEIIDLSKEVKNKNKAKQFDLNITNLLRYIFISIGNLIN